MAFQGSSMPFKATSGDAPRAEDSDKVGDDGYLVDFATVYDIGEKLGSGTFGNVHRCTHRVNGQQHAVKTIDLRRLTANQRSRSLDEARICQKLDHDNVIRLHRLFQDDSSLHFVLELVSGGELFEEIVSREFYSEQDASDCMKQVLSAICHCHKLGIVHRDLKPENILLSHKPKSQKDPVIVKVADFGLAIQLPDGCDSVSLSICGTPGYIAPETLRHQPIGTSVDLWACGVLLYILLAGYPPFWAKQRADLFEKIKGAEYLFSSPDWDNVSASAKSLVRSMLTIHPMARITASEALTHPWICMRRNVAKSLHRQATLKKLMKFNARRKFRGAILTTRALALFNKISSLDMTKDNRGEGESPTVEYPNPLSKTQHQQTGEFVAGPIRQLEKRSQYDRQDSNCSTGSQEEGIVTFNLPFPVPREPDAFPDPQPGLIVHTQTDYDDEDYLDDRDLSKRQKTDDSLEATSS